MSEIPRKWTELTIRVEENGEEEVTEYADGHWSARKSFTVSVDRCGSPGTPSPRR